MSGPYFFGLHEGKLSAREVRRRTQIAKRHGAYRYVQIERAGRDGSWYGWFETANLGAPWDQRVASAVLREVFDRRTNQGE